jgi:hypothetical protein
VGERVMVSFLGTEGAASRFYVSSAWFAQRAKSYEGKIIPTFAASVPAVRDRSRNIERAFRGEYADWRSGMRGAVFPFGTLGDGGVSRGDGRGDVGEAWSGWRRGQPRCAEGVVGRRAWAWALARGCASLFVAGVATSGGGSEGWAGIGGVGCG